MLFNATLYFSFRMSGIEVQIVAVTQFCTGNCRKLDTGELDGPNLLQGLRDLDIWVDIGNDSCFPPLKGFLKICAGSEVCPIPSDWEW